ncbi:hypothetical protein Z043_126251, partial [Scleropages formosus]
FCDSELQILGQGGHHIAALSWDEGVHLPSIFQGYEPPGPHRHDPEHVYGRLRTGQELLFCGAVGGLLYSCCQQLHHFLSQPNNSFWVAETMVNSQSKIPGM